MEPEPQSEFARACRRLSFFRWVYGVGACFGVVITGFAMTWLTNREVDFLSAGTAISLCAFSTASHIVAYMLLLRRPLMWTAIAAIIPTLIVAFVWIPLLQQGLEHTTSLWSLYVWSAWPICFWCIVYLAWQAERAARQVPVLLGAQESHRIARTEFPDPNSGMSSTLSAAIAASVVLTLTGVIATHVYASSRPVSLATQIQKFVNAWNREALNEIVDMTMPPQRSEVSELLASARRTHHWDQGWPEIGADQARQAMDRACTSGLIDHATFQLGEGLIQTEWYIDPGFLHWSLAGLVLPRMNEQAK